MVKLRIEYDREHCIGAMSCTSVDPKRWLENKGENKAELINGKLNSKGIHILEGNFPEDELEDIITGARVCPVQVIGITNLETGEILFKREEK